MIAQVSPDSPCDLICAVCFRNARFPKFNSVGPHTNANTSQTDAGGVLADVGAVQTVSQLCHVVQLGNLGTPCRRCPEYPGEPGAMLKSLVHTCRALSEVLATLTKIMQRPTAWKVVPKQMVGISTCRQ